MHARYGQHFLSNRHAAERIVAAVNPGPHDTIVEIGPGKGALTELLLPLAGRVVAVEVDPQMVEKLRPQFGERANFELVQADILEFDWDRHPALAPAPVVKIVGNLPYNLTSPILRKISFWTRWNHAWVMVQKEVGDRLTAQPDTADYGALTAGMALSTQAAPVFDLSENSFSPPPRVKSSVVRLTRRVPPLTTNVNTAQRVIQAAFQQRRKTILNSLSHGLGLEKPAVEAGLAKAGLAPTARAENLTPTQFVRLSELLLAS